MEAIWVDTGQAIAADELNLEGVPYERIDTTAYAERIQEIMSARGYVVMDEVKMSPDMPSFAALCEKFRGEHLHSDDEVRFVLRGAGVFEIRSSDDRWMRVTVEAGDFILVPARRYHRFGLTLEGTIHCVRLFKDTAGWVPMYRDDTPSDRVGG
jgi:1,2-dihydroxy-3-keto-5-methylthiopentene dioxygenase